jgi:hypothetical protein
MSVPGQAKREDPTGFDELTFQNGNLLLRSERTTKPTSYPIHTLRSLKYLPRDKWWQFARPCLHLEIEYSQFSFGYGLDPEQAGQNPRRRPKSRTRNPHPGDLNPTPEANVTHHRQHSANQPN